MSGPLGRAAVSVSLPGPLEAPAPAWLQGLLDGLIEEERASAAAAVVGDARGVRAVAAAGDARCRGGGGAPLFDLASLTKPWTASLALRLDSRGLLPLATPLGDLWRRCHPRLAAVTLEELLRHRGRLLPWTPLYRRCREPERVAELLVGGGLSGARRGTYSDLGYVLWGLAAERALGRPLGALLRREVIEPLGLRARPGRSACWPACRLDNGREVDLAAEQGIRVRRSGPPGAGEAQDGNARFLGSPAGHAGLFATPGAMLALAREWLAPEALWPAASVRSALAGGGPWALGWRRATRRNSGGPALGAGAFGHVGFTGGSVWIAPAARRILVLLAHRATVDVDLAAVRRRFHARALAHDGEG